MVKVKICGITNLEDALACFFAGAHALGFIFYKKSPRYISPARVRNISRILPKNIVRVGVFVNERAQTVKRIAKTCGLDILQFHGQETSEYCRKFQGYKVIKAFRVKDKVDLRAIFKYKTYGYLFDSFSKSKLGGTGSKFNWKILSQAGRIKPILFLSGGLNSSNVTEAIKLLKPAWVDASTGLELKPGKKDHNKVFRFIRKTKNEK
ncbi:MAG: phosphoribosylanthranilate isomerase [Candidatus Omnitrophota bacterium]